MGYSPVIGVYDVLARWQGDRRLLVAGEASGHEVVGVRPRHCSQRGSVAEPTGVNMC
jgi:hypothetical protein